MTTCSFLCCDRQVGGVYFQTLFCFRKKLPFVFELDTECQSLLECAPCQVEIRIQSLSESRPGSQ